MNIALFLMGFVLGGGVFMIGFGIATAERKPRAQGECIFPSEWRGELDWRDM